MLLEAATFICLCHAGLSSGQCIQTIKQGSTGQCVETLQLALGLSADGIFGPATKTAVQNFQRANGLMADGVVGQQTWAKIIQASSESSNSEAPCQLTTYKGSRFTGSSLLVDVNFVPALRTISNYAEQANVKLFITSSFRPTSEVNGAVVTPAVHSNHMVGHAIDFNVQYGPNYASLCNSVCLARSNLPAPVKAFIEAVKKDKALRWGGDFS